MGRGHRGRIVALEGPSAAGKSTLVRELAAAGDWVPILEAFDRLRPRPSLRFSDAAELAGIERRLLSEERRRSREAVRRVSDGRSVLLDTGPLGPALYCLGLAELEPAFRTVADSVVRHVLDGLATGGLRLPDRVVVLVVPAPTLQQRARSAPGRHPRRLAERHWRVGSIEGTFWRELARRAPGGVVFVRGSGSLDGLSRRVARAAVRPGPRLPKRAVILTLRSVARRTLHRSHPGR